MKVLLKSPVLILVALLAINILTVLFQISILMDAIIDYRIGFWLNMPLLLLILTAEVFVFSRYLRKKNYQSRKIATSSVLFVAGFVNLLFWLFNVICWIDLIDGKTNALVP